MQTEIKLIHVNKMGPWWHKKSEEGTSWHGVDLEDAFQKSFL